MVPQRCRPRIAKVGGGVSAGGYVVEGKTWVEIAKKSRSDSVKERGRKGASDARLSSSGWLPR